MKYIGVFFDKHSDAVQAYRKHSQEVNNMSRNYGIVTVNPSDMTITIDNIRYMYYGFPTYEDVIRISGINFAAIFSEVSDSRIKQYIMARFRPSL